MKKTHAPKEVRAASARNSFCNATYYGVITCSLLVGLVGYSSGASLEGALIRVVIALLACTSFGYLLNVILWLTSSSQRPTPDAPPTGQGATPRVDGVNLTVGDAHVAA